MADEALWRDLLFYLRRGELIPVAGPGLNVVMPEQPSRTLTELIAQGLVDQYGLVAPTAPMTMGEATAMVIRQRGREAADRLYPTVCDIIENYSEYQCAPLRELAAITDFRLYISTTPDTLLAKAISPANRPCGFSADSSCTSFSGVSSAIWAFSSRCS